MSSFQDFSANAARLCRIARDFAQAETDPELKAFYNKAADLLGVFSQKAVWFIRWEQYKDGSALKNAVYALGFVGAHITEYVRAKGNLNTELPDFEEVSQFLEEVNNACAALHEKLMGTYVTIAS